MLALTMEEEGWKQQLAAVFPTGFVRRSGTARSLSARPSPVGRGAWKAKFFVSQSVVDQPDRKQSGAVPRREGQGVAVQGGGVAPAMERTRGAKTQEKVCAEAEVGSRRPH